VDVGGSQVTFMESRAQLACDTLSLLEDSAGSWQMGKRKEHDKKWLCGFAAIITTRPSNISRQEHIPTVPDTHHRTKGQDIERVGRLT
jgi:hypothetical protein